MLRRSLSGAVIALALLAFASTASAAPPVPTAEPSLIDFRLPASNGFEIGASAEVGMKSGVLSLEIGKRGEEATYMAKGEVTADRIDFDLGTVGTVSLEVRPTSGTSKIGTGCGGGKPAAVPRVELVGTFEFHGEEGFAEATATKLTGISVPLEDLRCGINEGGFSGEGLPGTFLTVRRRPAHLRLAIVQKHPGAAVSYEADLAERLRAGLSVTRTVLGREKADAFSFDGKLSKARLKAGPRLSGVLTYTATKLPEGPREGEGKVGGNLVVDFPGHAGVAIGGPGFTATIVHGERSSSDED
ncbi:MAG TPA: hypothetical protein VJ204_17530 [Solirubrobacterales bacterium]|nr:hypothetical protein [Solirubrobacterales bacterium]